MSQTDPSLPPDLLEVARTLEADGPRMTETEFARVRRTALKRVSTAGPRPAAPFTRSRVAITSMLAVGALMSTGGAALGVSALSTDLSARAAQYGQSTQQAGTDGAANSGSNGSGSARAANSGNNGSGSTTANAASGQEVDTLGGVGSTQAASAGGGETAATAAVQGTRQLEASSTEDLPFTGFAAIPMLLVGLGLLASGLVLRGQGRRAPAV